MREVEAQAIGTHQRAFLSHMITQQLTQTVVHQVSDRVVERRGLTTRSIDRGGDRLTYFQGTQFQLTKVQYALTGFLGVFDHKQAVIQLDHAGITNLTTGLRVEGGLVQHHGALFTCNQRRHRFTVLEYRRHPGRLGQMLITGKIGFAIHLDDLGVIHTEVGGFLGPLPLLLHQGFETGFVDAQLAITQYVGGQIRRETVGIVQLEHHFARQHLGIAQLCNGIFQQLQAATQGAGKLLFFQPQYLLDHGALGIQLRVGIGHLLAQRAYQGVEERLFGTQLATMAHGTTNDTTQHIAPAFVGRHDTVGDQEGTGTNVVGNHAQRLVVQIFGADGLGRRLDQCLEQVDFVVGMHALQYGGDTLQPHTGIDRRLGQRLHGAVCMTVELHEHQVPDLDVTVAVFFRAAGRTAPDMLAVIVEDLGAGTARAGITHGPEVVGCVLGTLVVADTHDTLGRHTHFLRPDVEGFVIGGVHCHPQLVFGQLDHFGQKFPGEANGILLEVVTKTEVTQHFEKSMVTRGITHILQIVVLAAGTHATLRAGGPVIGPLLQPQEQILELVHAGIGKQQGRVVVRNQRAGCHHLVALLAEILEKRSA